MGGKRGIRVRFLWIGLVLVLGHERRRKKKKTAVVVVEQSVSQEGERVEEKVHGKVEVRKNAVLQPSSQGKRERVWELGEFLHG